MTQNELDGLKAEGKIAVGRKTLVALVLGLGVGGGGWLFGLVAERQAEQMFSCSDQERKQQLPARLDTGTTRGMIHDTP